MPREEALRESGAAGLPTASTLLPCPFCGGNPTLFDTSKPVEGASSGDYFLECDGCHLVTNLYAEDDEAIAAWNTRAPLLSAKSITAAEVALDEAKQHILTLTSFWMDNAEWTTATERARAFISDAPTKQAAAVAAEEQGGVSASERANPPSPALSPLSPEEGRSALPPGRSKQDVANLVDLALSDSMVPIEGDEATVRYDYDTLVEKLRVNGLAIVAISPSVPADDGRR